MLCVERSGAEHEVTLAITNALVNTNSWYVTGGRVPAHELPERLSYEAGRLDPVALLLEITLRFTQHRQGIVNFANNGRDRSARIL
jgi:hypothetical protein